jgi:hypothetical protein
MKWFASHALTDFVVCTGDRGDVNKDYFLNYDGRINDINAHLGKSTHLEVHSNHAEIDGKVTVAAVGPIMVTTVRHLTRPGSRNIEKTRMRRLFVSVSFDDYLSNLFGSNRKPLTLTE